MFEKNMSMRDVDEMDIGYFIKIMNYESKEKDVYAGDLDFL